MIDPLILNINYNLLQMIHPNIQLIIYYLLPIKYIISIFTSFFLKIIVTSYTKKCWL